MRIEYILTNFVNDFFGAIDDFFSNFSSVYTLLDSQDDIRVYRNVNENLDLIFFAYDINRILLFVTPLYDSEREIWYQENIICSGYDRIVRSRNEYNSTHQFSYFFQAPTLYSGNVLVANYNTENNTFMFSVIRNIPIDYGFTATTIKATTNIVFGNTTKYLDFNGGFFYGGDHVYTYDRYYIERIDNRTRQETLLSDGVSVYQDSNIDYIDKDISNDNVNKLEFILRADIDNAPLRYHDYSISQWEFKMGNLSDSNSPIRGIYVPDILRTNLWAVTMDIKYYTRMVSSITNSVIKVPRYEPLLSHVSIDKGHTNNTLNNISMIMPLWFMVRRDPEALDNYSAVGKNDVINFVNMYNMCTNSMENGTYPIKEHKYNCFQIGTRRSMVGMKGYSGIAFKQEGEEDDSSVDNLDLLDLNEMEQHIVPDETTPILNIEVEGKFGYGGDTRFTDMPEGSFILKHPYTDYSSIIFEFCDDSGTVTDTVTWSKTDLDNALNGSSAFNLLPADSPVTWAGMAGSWEIEPFSNGSTTTKFLCNYQNCGLIGAKGIV